jgi:ribonuclease HI
MMRPYINLTDDELILEINEHFAAKKKIATGGIAVIAGEGRRVEYTAGSTQALTDNLRMLEYEARQRGLEIAGEGGAIAVEFR